MNRVQSILAKLGRRARIALITATALLGVYLVVGFFVAGPILRSVIADNLTNVLDRTTTVGKVRVNPVTFRVVVENLAIARKEGEGSFVSFDALDVQVHALSVFKLAPVLSHLKLIHPDVEVEFLGAGIFSFSDLIPATNSTEQAASETESDHSAIIPFRVDNLSITNGTLTFRDMPHKATHVVSELYFSVPLTSTLSENRDDFVEPSLKALINGQPVELAGKIKPFDKSLVTEFVFETNEFDIARYWEYVPVQTPLKLSSGKVSSKIVLDFSRPEGEMLSMKIAGGLKVSDFAMSAPDMKNVVGFSSLSVDVEQFSLFENALSLRDVVLDEPYVKAVRGADGLTNWEKYLPVAQDSESGVAPKGAAPVKSGKASKSKAKQAPAKAAAPVKVKAVPAKDKAAAGIPFVMDAVHIAVKNGRIEWADNAVAGGFTKQIKPIHLEVTNLSTRKGREGHMALTIGAKERIAVKGAVSVQPVKADLDVDVTGMDLLAYSAYLEAAQPMKVDAGSIALALHALVAVDDADPLPDVQISKLDFALQGLKLRNGGNKLPSIELGKLHVAGGVVDLRKETASVSEIVLSAPVIRLVRNADGLDLVELFARGDGTPQGAKKPEPVKKEGSKKPKAQSSTEWNAVVDEFRIENGTVRFVDRSLNNAAHVNISDLNLSVQDASSDLSKPVAVTYSAHVGGGRRDVRVRPGLVRVSGTVRPSPLDVQVRIRHDKVPLTVFDPYIGQYTGLMLAGGTLTTDMNNRFGIPESGDALFRYASKGTLRVNDLLLKDESDSSPVVGFSKFEVSNYDVSSEKSNLLIEEISLNDLQGNAAVDKEGVLNIVRLLNGERKFTGEVDPADSADAAKGAGTVKPVAQSAPVAQQAAPDQPSVQSAAQAPEPSVGQSSGVSAVETGQAAPDDTPQAANEQYVSLLPYQDVRIDRVRVNNGAFRFNDRSVSPPFATALTELNVRLDNMTLAADARPELDLTAKLDSQSLSLKGVVNPLITPMYSDLSFNLSGLDLVPLTPYALRSVAYPVEKGRLYADVKFNTENWVLDAKNKFFVEQLILGEKDKRPDAPSIPIKLGLALLSDSSGNIEIDLPIKGRLDDPQFLTGGIVFKAFINLIFKVVTSPFALIGNMVGGGGEDAQYSIFDPGSMRLTEGQLKSLDSVVAFMNKKAGLKLEIAGFADPEPDTKGMIELGLRRAVQAAKYADLSRRERAATTVEDVQIAPEEYVKYLTEAYKAAPEQENDPRPSGIFGFKEQSVGDMEAFLRSLTTVTPESLNELATERAKAVQTAILKLDPALAPRVFLVGSGKKPADKTGVAKTRVELGVK